MKFGKSLSSQIVETLPEWRDKFLSYKDLKKRLKLIVDAIGVERRTKRQRVGSGGSPPPMTPDEAGFVCLLEAELEKFNAFFLGKEEDYVIRQKVLDSIQSDSCFFSVALFRVLWIDPISVFLGTWWIQELQGRVVRAAETGSAEELMRVGKEIVDFHGEMVLLENYSALNYTGEIFLFSFCTFCSWCL
jgi:hypothetical protein